MARNEHLPIYKAAYDLCLWLEQVVRGFSRYHKYAIGSDLRESSRRILRLVVRANARTDKAPVLLELREEVEELKAMIRLCHDAKGFAGIAAFEHGARLVVEIAKQDEGWLRSAQARRSTDERRGATDNQPPKNEGRGQNRSAGAEGNRSARAGRAMIMRSPSRRAGCIPRGERRSPTSGPRHKGLLPRYGGAGSPGPVAAIGVGGASRPHCRGCREQAEGATQSNNYWSSTTYQNNPSNAWNVNFNDGNPNANNKTNNNFVRAVRSGS